MGAANTHAAGGARSSLAWSTVQTLVAIACFGGVWAILIFRGSADWSSALAVVFYALLIAAFVLSLTGWIGAFLGRSVPRSQRWFSAIAGIAIPSVILAGVVLVLNAISHMN